MRENLIDLIEQNHSLKIASGELVRFRDYLQGAITAFDLNDCDYYTALFVLENIAEGKDSKEMVADLKTFWEGMHNKYGK